KLTSEERIKLGKRPTENSEAYRLYLKGRYFWNQRGKALLKATEYWEQARLADPQFALAYAGLADSYSQLGYDGFLAPRDTYPKATAAARRALELDASLGEVHASLGFIHFSYDWDMAMARREYLRAIQLAPNCPPAHYGYAVTFSVTGEWDRSFEEIKKSIELDPLSPCTNAQMGWALLRHGEYARSIEVIRKAIELTPTLAIARMLLGHALIKTSRFPEAIAELQEAVKISEGDAWVRGSLAYAYSLSGKKDLASKLLEELRWNAVPSGYRRSMPIALAYTGLGEKDRAFEFLDKAYEERDSCLALVQQDHLFDTLHSDPRWAALVGRIGVAPEAPAR
ncbi:MAG TPA: tetratricopeptide repeat protein, partial [Candidatus Polarisedimenticolia bacterium]|nr:tetratricopeptide repeat protein [Candidatus Polarisedimenticolia bacterium]